MSNHLSPLDMLLRETRNLIAFHSDCGLDYPLSTGIKAFLKPAAPQAKPQSPASPAVTAKRMLQKIPERDRADGQTMDELRNSVGNCRRCPRGETRPRMIFGEGSTLRGLNLFIILDPPGAEDEMENKPITGPPRELLVKMLSAINLSPEDTFLTNIIKCAMPPQPLPANEATSVCLPFLIRQIELLQPKIICTMGAVAAQAMLKTTQQLFIMRGRFHDFHGIPLMPTFHPAQLIKTPELKKASWHDLQMILQKISS